LLGTCQITIFWQEWTSHLALYPQFNFLSFYSRYEKQAVEMIERSLFEIGDGGKLGFI